ncbi:MAG: hypothetical protein L0229_10520 [Blastocatellia bacterium]|nr:hypothetical protein [Blastocatellia bacterium]
MRKSHYLIISLIMLVSLFVGAVLATRILAAQSTQSSQGTQLQQPATLQTPTQKQWEYRVVSAEYDSELQRELNKAGEQGFEITQFQIQEEKLPDLENNSLRMNYRYVAILKRAKL